MLNHLETHRAGSFGYYKPHRRGTIDVYFDTKRYVYERPARFTHAIKKDWKIALACAFDGRVTGTAPVYRIL